MSSLRRYRPTLDLLQEEVSDTLIFHPRSERGLAEKIRRTSDCERIYLEMLLKTEIEAYKNAGRHALPDLLGPFYVHTDPEASALKQPLFTSIVEHPSFPALRRSPLYKNACRNIQLQCEQFTPENHDCEIGLKKYEDEADRIHSGITVELDGERIAIGQAEARCYSSDRAASEHVWRSIQHVRAEKKDALDIASGGSIRLRHAIAKNAGHSSYSQYQLYGNSVAVSVSGAREFARAVKRIALPLSETITERHKKRLGLTVVYPWDTNAARGGGVATPKGMEPLRPFETHKELLCGVQEILERLHPMFGTYFQELVDARLINVRMRKGKTPPALCLTTPSLDLAYVQSPSTGTHEDMVTLVHEMGHALETLYGRDRTLVYDREMFTDSLTSETMSQTLEMLTMPHWNVFYDAEDHKRAERTHLEEIVRFFGWAVTVDRFEHYLHRNPENHTKKAQDAYFGNLMRQYYPRNISWHGLEPIRKNYWQQQSHIFSSPFYYIDYAISRITALQMYKRSLEDPQGAVEGLMRGLSLGAGTPYREVCKAMGTTFISPSRKDFPDHLRSLLHFVMDRLDGLDD